MSAQQAQKPAAESAPEEPVAASEERVQPDPAETEWGRYILGYCAHSKESEEYAREHLARFIRTLELTPGGSDKDRILEMGAYMQITPALHHRLGYGEVHGSDLGPAGNVAHKQVRSTSGEEFKCDIELFDAEQDSFPYPDEHFKAVLCCELLEHLNQDPMRMMSEINRITKLGGWLVMTTPNICSTRVWRPSSPAISRSSSRSTCGATTTAPLTRNTAVSTHLANWPTCSATRATM